MNQGFNGIQVLQHEKPILEVNEITKLHKHDTTSSYNEFLRYAQSYKLIVTTSTTHPMTNETPNLYSKGATLSNFIHEGRPTTTKLTLIDLPSSIDHPTFRECSKGILCLPPISHHSLLTRLTEFRQPLQVQSHLEVPRILVQLGHIQRT